MQTFEPWSAEVMLKGRGCFLLLQPTGCQLGAHGDAGRWLASNSAEARPLCGGCLMRKATLSREGCLFVNGGWREMWIYLSLRSLDGKVLQPPEAILFKAMVGIICMSQVSALRWLEEGRQMATPGNDLKAWLSSLGLASTSVPWNWFLLSGGSHRGLITTI